MMTTEAKPAPDVRRNLSVTQIMIKGMTNVEAARAVRKRLLDVDGIHQVRMTIADQSARVEYEPSKVSPSMIGTIIGAMGYRWTVRSMLRTM